MSLWIQMFKHSPPTGRKKGFHLKRVCSKSGTARLTDIFGGDNTFIRTLIHAYYSRGASSQPAPSLWSSFPCQHSVLLSRTDGQLVIFTGVHVRLHGYGRAGTQWRQTRCFCCSDRSSVDTRELHWWPWENGERGGKSSVWSKTPLWLVSGLLLWLPAAKIFFGNHNVVIVSHLYILLYKKNNPFKVGSKMTGELLL